MGKTIGTVLALKNQCSPQLKKIAKVLGISENKARQLNNQVKRLARQLGEGLKKASIVCTSAIAATAAATSALVISAGQTCDRIDDLSNKIGISRQGFQEWDYLLEQNGGHIESLQMGFKTLVNQVTKANSGNKEAAKTFKSLGISLKDSNGNLKTQEQIFNELVPALQRMPEGVKKAKIANDLLGRSGAELMPLFNATNEQLARQREEYKKLGLAISDDVIDAGNKFGDNVAKWQTITKAFGASLAGDILPVLNDLSDTFISKMPKIKATVKPFIEGLINTFKFLTEHIEMVSIAATALISTFVAYNAIKGVIITIQTLQNVIKTVTLAQGLWNAVMIANPIGVVAVGIGGLITLVVLLIKNWDTVKAAAVSFGKTAIKIFNDLWQKIKPIFENIIKYAKIAFSFSPFGLAVNAVQKITPQKHALGTLSSTGGLSLVGEYGPELVNLPKGSSVTPANKTTQLLQGGRKIECHIHVAGNIYGEQDFMNKIINRFTIELNKVIPV